MKREAARRKQRLDGGTGDRRGREGKAVGEGMRTCGGEDAHPLITRERSRTSRARWSGRTSRVDSLGSHERSVRHTHTAAGRERSIAIRRSADWFFAAGPIVATRVTGKGSPRGARTPLSTRGFVAVHLRNVRDGPVPGERQPSAVRDARESRLRRREKRNRTQGGSSHRHGAEELARAVGDWPGSERARGCAGLLREPFRGEGALEAIFPRGARRPRPATPRATRPRPHRIRRRPPAI